MKTCYYLLYYSNRAGPVLLLSRPPILYTSMSDVLHIPFCFAGLLGEEHSQTIPPRLTLRAFSINRVLERGAFLMAADERLFNTHDDNKCKLPSHEPWVMNICCLSHHPLFLYKFLYFRDNAGDKCFDIGTVFPQLQTQVNSWHNSSCWSTNGLAWTLLQL